MWLLCWSCANLLVLGMEAISTRCYLLLIFRRHFGLSWAELFLVPAYVADMEVGRGLNSVRIIAFVLGWGMSPFPSANVG